MIKFSHIHTQNDEKLEIVSLESINIFTTCNELKGINPQFSEKLSPSHPAAKLAEILRGGQIYRKNKILFY
jgi:hypothetical protein